MMIANRIALSLPNVSKSRKKSAAFLVLILPALPPHCSLVPLFLFIISVLYAFCRLGVFAVCNPFRWCPKSPDTELKLEVLTPQRLFQVTSLRLSGDQIVTFW